MIKLVAFDWNGTIFADSLAAVDAVNEVFKFLGVKAINLKKFQACFDIPARNAYIAMGASAEVLDRKKVEVAHVFHTNYEQRAGKVRSRAFAKELLIWLSKNQIEALIFSNHLHEPIKIQLKRLKIGKYFNRVLANTHPESAFRGRAKAEKLKDYIISKKLSAKEVLVIGDSIEEIEIGKELGFYTAAITHGYCSTLRLKKAKPDFLISNLKEVIKIIGNLNP
ncbi:MAG: HAD family hydrolase [Patescibacteria group bacterium]|nr:HAD family hydrolase [Patescibacteria group bacterium]